MNEHLLNPEALGKAYAAYYANIGFHSEKIKAAIRTYLASLPERDSLALSAIAEEKAKTRALGRAEAAEAEVARLKAELAEGCDLLDRFDGHLPTVRRYLERVRSFRDGQKT